MQICLDDLRAVPHAARRDAGYQLDKVQNGLMPSDGKPMPAIGIGVQEIRIRDETGGFRVIYVAKFANAVHLLHCFQKKTHKTGSADLDLAAKRYADLARELSR